MTEKLPRGIWHEVGPNRNRYRVRVYRRARRIHLSYHDTLEEAVTALKAAREHQNYVRQEDQRMDCRTPAGQLLALTNGLL
jgi:hypothetical protein